MKKANTKTFRPSLILCVLLAAFLLFSCANPDRETVPETVPSFNTDNTDNTEAQTDTTPPDSAQTTAETEKAAESTAPETETESTDGESSAVQSTESTDTAQTSPPDMSIVSGESVIMGETEPPAEPHEEPQVPAGSLYPTVLTYHLIYDEPFTEYTNLFVRTADFEDQLRAMTDAGYTFLFADSFGGCATKSVILTFDDGYEDNYTNMFPLLKRYNARATVFMITDKIDMPGYLTSDQIREMADSGLVRFGSHTVSHSDLRSLGGDRLRRELSDSKQIIENLTGQEVNCVCYPAGGYSAAALAEAANYYSFGFTTRSGKYSGEGALEIPRIAVRRGVNGQSLLWLLGG
ncbi:MAG: polysaccharide deacetylase family protein [Candidatus Avispirillum sp.]